MGFKLNNPPFPKHTDLHKKTGLGPRELSTEAKEDAAGVGSGSNKTVMTTTKEFSSRNAEKSDAQKKYEARKLEVANMSKEELAAEQARVNKKRQDFEKSDEYKARKARTSSLPYIGEKLKIESVSKNSINIPNTNSKNKTEAFMNAPYRDPNTTGPRVKRKGYHGWRKTDK